MNESLNYRLYFHTPLTSRQFVGKLFTYPMNYVWRRLTPLMAPILEPRASYVDKAFEYFIYRSSWNPHPFLEREGMKGLNFPVFVYQDAFSTALQLLDGWEDDYVEFIGYCFSIED